MYEQVHSEDWPEDVANLRFGRVADRDGRRHGGSFGSRIDRDGRSRKSASRAEFSAACAASRWVECVDCAACHDKAVGPAFERSAHGKQDQSCAKCHQNVAEHVKAKIVRDDRRTWCRR